ncbi:MAG: hypothetical protein ACKVXR_11560 [Planctomycetota bacterium]
MSFDHLLTTASAALAVLALSPSALADGRKPGSLLVFPEFDNRVGDVSMLTVTNTSTDMTHDPMTNLPSGSVRVHFIYVGRVDASGNPISCLEFDRQTLLSPGDTYTFLTRSHNPLQEQGFMYAYAKHPTSGEAIDFDYLIGNALFLSGVNSIDYSMNPISLQGLPGHGIATDSDNDGNRDLDGSEYEMLPDEILIPRFLATRGSGGEGGPILRGELILLGLSGGSRFDTIADFLIYNDNEEVFSAQWQFRCWERVPLDTISGVFLQSFLVTTDQAANEPLGATGRESGWIHINGGVAYSTTDQILDPAVYAVLVDRPARVAGASDLPFECGTQDNGSLWPNVPYGDNLSGDNR